MFLVKIFIFLFLQNNLSVFCDKNAATATAVADVIDVFFVKEEIPFDIFVFSENPSNYCDIVNEIGRRNGGRYHTTVKIFTNNSYLDFKLELNQSAVIFADDDLMKDLYNTSTMTNDYAKRLKILHYCKNECYLEVSASIFSSEQLIVTFQYFLRDYNDNVELATGDWWTEEKCNILSTTIINEFDKKSMKWNKKLENHEKFTNFHGCLITLNTNNFPPIPTEENSTEFFNHYYPPFESMAEALNFTFYFEPFGSFEHPLIEERNKPIDGKFLFQNVEIATAPLSNDFLHDYHITTTFGEDVFIFVTSPGALYTPYEKVLLPFDAETWWCLIATFSGAFLVISIVNRMPKAIRNLVFGNGIKMPAFNVVGTFFGIGQLKLPTNNFARIILMTFIMFCLVIRVAYQGVQFEMMTKEMRRKPAQSLQQLYDENYIFCAENRTISHGLLLRMIELSKRSQIKAYHYDDTNSVICNLNSSVKSAVIYSKNTIKYNNALCSGDLKILPERLLAIPMGFGLPKNHFLFPSLEDYMQKTIPFGIPQYFYENYMEYFYKFIRDPIDDSPTVLTLESLSFGYVIWLVACGVSLCGLFCEIITHYCTKRRVSTQNINDEIIPEVNAVPVIDVNDEIENDQPENVEILIQEADSTIVEIWDIEIDENHTEYIVEHEHSDKYAVEYENTITNIELVEKANSFFGESVKVDENPTTFAMEHEKTESMIELIQKPDKTVPKSDEIIQKPDETVLQISDEEIDENSTENVEKHVETKNSVDSIESTISFFRKSVEIDDKTVKSLCFDKTTKAVLQTAESTDEAKGNPQIELQIEEIELNQDSDDVFEPKWEDDLCEYY